MNVAFTSTEGNPNLQGTTPSEEKKNNIVVPIAAAIGGAIIILLLILASVYFIRRKRSNSKGKKPISCLYINPFFISVFNFKLLQPQSSWTPIHQ